MIAKGVVLLCVEIPESRHLKNAARAQLIGVPGC